MRVAADLKIMSPDRWDERPARLALVDDQGDEMSSIPLTELAAALAPFITITLKGSES